MFGRPCRCWRSPAWGYYAGEWLNGVAIQRIVRKSGNVEWLVWHSDTRTLRRWEQSRIHLFADVPLLPSPTKQKRALTLYILEMYQPRPWKQKATA